MARQATIKIYRGTRAGLNALAAANALIDGEPYWITDEDVLAIGLGVNTYQEFSKKIVSASDANGYYRKFPDGIMECFLPVMLVDHVADTHKTTTWTMPSGAVFLNTASMQINVNLQSVGSTYGFVQKYLTAQPSSTTAVEINAQFSVSQNYRFSCLVRGRWA